MGFYGHIIKDPGQTQFYFDRKYSNLAELKAHETTDGIYSGRYVLVEYSEDFKFKGIALQGSNIIKEDDGSLYSKTDGLLEGDFVSITIDKNTAVYKCISFTNKGIAVFDTTPAIQGEKINYYDFNYNVDRVYLQESFGRGYDSTVWQKVFIDDDEIVEKYVMIAELNSVTPTFNIITDAPTDETKAIEVRGDSTNLNYNIVMPAVWGFDFPKEITYNKAGFEKEVTSYDENDDTFKIEDVSKKGIGYPLGQNDTEVKADTKRLTINLPSIGNAISNVWDIVYGESLKQGEKRPLIPEKLDKTKVGDVSKIYIDDDGVLYRAVGETYAKLPADDNTGALKALQLKMHHYLGTGEDSPSNNTIPGAINSANQATQNANIAKQEADLARDYANEQGTYAKNQGDFANEQGTYANDRGNYANDQGDYANEKGIYANERGSYANSQGDFAKEQANIARTLIGTNDDKGLTTIHGVINVTNTLLGSTDLNNVDTSTINGAINRASEAINTAVAATTNANEKATFAQEQGNYAKGQGDYAKGQGDYAKEQGDYANDKANIANNLIGSATDSGEEITTIYGAINRVKEIVTEKFSANNIVENDNRVFVSKTQKDSLFDGENRLFYQTTETYNKNEVDTKIANLVDSAPEALNTLGELAEALGKHEDAYDALLTTVGGKQDEINGAASSITDTNLETSKVLVSDSNGKVAASSITNTELSYLSGVNSSIQTQINNIKYAGSSSVGGSANSAVKLDSSAGSATQPVYFSNGQPVATTYTLGKSVPSDAVFTDTTYTSLKNPHAITIQGNGTTLTNGVYDGSAAKTVNITPSSIGAAASSHNHNASNITSGVLPIERGGTGATTATNARINLGIPKIDSGTSLPDASGYSEGDIFFLIKE